MPTILLVRTGGYGSFQSIRGDYDDFIATTRIQIRLAAREGTERPQVEVVNSAEDAFRRAAAGTADLIAFITKGEYATACRLKLRFPELPVLIFSNAAETMRETSVVVLDKYMSVARWRRLLEEHLHSAVQT